VQRRVCEAITRACLSLAAGDAGAPKRRLRMGTIVAPSKPGGRDNMNSDILEGQWMQLKGKVKSKWGQLTDDDLTLIGGKKDQLIGRVQERYGVARDEAERQVDEFYDEATGATTRTGRP
jgi:uncharacterized protein YjbJ (UPF0337 family)